MYRVSTCFKEYVLDVYSIEYVLVVWSNYSLYGVSTRCMEYVLIV